MKRTIDGGIFVLCLLAAAGAECIPLALAFIAAAGGLAALKPFVGR